MPAGSVIYRQQNNFLQGVTQYYPLYMPGAKSFFVAPSTYGSADDGLTPSNSNDGETPFSPKATIAGALAACVSGRGDTIVLMPGTYTLAAAVAFTAKVAVRLVALKPYSATITADGVITKMLSIDSNDVELAGLRFEGVAAAVTLVDIANTSAVRNTHIHHCKFIGLETVTGVTGILNGELAAGNDAAHTIVEDCEFEGLSAEAIKSFGGGAVFRRLKINLDDTAGATGIEIGDQGGAFGARKATFFEDIQFCGQTDASSLLAITFTGSEANTPMWSAKGLSFSSCAAPTANIHPEGAAGASYVGTATTTAPTLWPA
jgi:hypothetical protein